MAADEELEFVQRTWNDAAGPYTDVTVQITVEDDAEDAAKLQAACVKYELAKASQLFRARIERWAGSADSSSGSGGGSDGSSGATLQVSVCQDELPAMQQLLEFIHTRQLSNEVAADSLQLCHLLKLAHFYAVGPLLEAASAALQPLVPQLEASRCAAIFAALHPLADGSGPVQHAVAACFQRLESLLTPLEVIFSVEGLRQLFERLPLVAVQALTKPAPSKWSSQETALLAVLHWLQANADDSCGGSHENRDAAEKLLSQVEVSQVDSSLLLVAAHTNPTFRGWSGAMAALAGAVFAREAAAHLSPFAGAWRSSLAPVCPGIQPAVLPQPQPLQLELAVPLGWFEEEAARLLREATQLQQQQQQQLQQQVRQQWAAAPAAPAEPQQQDGAAPAAAGAAGPAQRQQPGGRAPLLVPPQQQGAAAAAFVASAGLWPAPLSVYEGRAVVYRGYSWRPSLHLSMKLPLHSWQAPAPNARLFDAHGRPLQGTRLQLSAELQLRAQALPTLLAGRGTAGGGSSETRSSSSSASATDAAAVGDAAAAGGAGTTGMDGRLPSSLPFSSLGPMARVRCSTSRADLRHPDGWRWELEPGSGSSHALFGAYSQYAATPAWLPPAGISCQLSAFEMRPSGEPRHTLPDLSVLEKDGKVHFRMTVEMLPSAGGLQPAGGQGSSWA